MNKCVTGCTNCCPKDWICCDDGKLSSKETVGSGLNLRTVHGTRSLLPVSCFPILFSWTFTWSGTRSPAARSHTVGVSAPKKGLPVDAPWSQMAKTLCCIGGCKVWRSIFRIQMLQFNDGDGVFGRFQLLRRHLLP